MDWIGVTVANASCSSLRLVDEVPELITVTQELRINSNDVTTSDDAVLEDEVTESVLKGSEKAVIVEEALTMLGIEAISHSVSTSTDTTTTVTDSTQTTTEVVSEIAAPTQEESSPKSDGKKWKEVESVCSPAIDIVEDKDNYYLYAEVAGMKSEDISIEISNKTLTLEGYKQNHHTPRSKKRKDSDVVRQEINKGRFKRVLLLPDNADTDHANASVEEGVLQFKIRKLAEVAEDKEEDDSSSEQHNSEQDNEENSEQDNNADNSEQDSIAQVNTEQTVLEEKEADKVGEEEGESEVHKEAGDVEEGTNEDVKVDDGVKVTGGAEKKKNRRSKKKLNQKRSSCLMQ